MYIYSEKTNKKYDSVEACEQAEREYDEEQRKAKAEKERLANERSNRAKEVDEARAEMLNAYKKYENLLAKFTEDYGGYHFTVRRNSPLNILDWFFE